MDTPANVVLDLLLVVVIPLDVAGVAIGTVASQMVSCILVLWCLCRTEGSYQLRFSKLKIRAVYLKRIFQVGIQSTVINFSNAMLQSSVNSFGSIAMAGYTAANNILGFLYVSVNAVTQACMSFTSQNYSVGKQKRMDRVLLDCMFLSAGTAFVLGMGRSAAPMLLSVIGTVRIRIVWLYGFFPHRRSLHFLFISYPCSGHLAEGPKLAGKE